VVVSGVIIWWLRQLKRDETSTAVSLALILGGAIGNVIDRVWHGHVIDFFDLHYAGYHWPTFNIADSAITVGAVILIITSLIPAPRGTQKS
jgi:signal peptidase II